MKLFTLLFVATATFTSLAFSGEPINTTCPMSGNDIKPNVTSDFENVTIGFCCNGCAKGFNKWNDERKVAYVADQKTSNAKPEVAEISELLVATPYLLDTCPITGMKLGSMGEPPVEVIDGREVRFCCAGCIPKFNADKKAKFQEIDAKMIAQQLPYYPIDTCVISGDALDIHGSAVNFIYGNRLFRTCCNDCKAELIEDPSEYVAELDKAIIKAQKNSYPIDYCVIGRGPLDGMGGPSFLIVGNRLVQLCCGGCNSKVLKDPLKVFAEIDKAKK